MASATKPGLRPTNPQFSSGPCAKRPGWTLDALSGAFLGRSHRAAAPKARLAEVIERSKSVLRMPKDWRLGIVPASDTGAVEMALWSLLGPRGVDVLAWESFSKDWATDVAKQLKLPENVLVGRDIADAGNTSAASIPLALHRLRAENPEISGRLALQIGFGAGLVFGAQVIRIP